MNKAEAFIENRLSDRTEAGLLRKLNLSNLTVDFCSNDYLGFARSPVLRQHIDDTISKLSFHHNGASGSRLLSGNYALTEDTETFIAKFHKAEQGLIFNSGYDANLGLLSCIPQRGDTIICDEFIHASLIDGARLSHANRYTFKHSCLDQLEAKLKLAKGRVYVVVESVYSMDGDLAPLQEISTLCQNYQAALIVDEAHATGMFGAHGAGLVQQLGLQDKIFARIVTFGKALGVHGAIVLGSAALRNYLINFARPFIYTTAAPMHSVVAVKCAYELLMSADYPMLIKQKIELFSTLANPQLLNCRSTNSPIQTIIYGSNFTARLSAEKLQQQGLDVRAILSPTVPEGTERLRICLHTYNTEEEIYKLIESLKSL